MEAAIDSILGAARSAPSGDNTQPVRFVVDFEARTIALILDPTRDPSPMNAGQRMARMAAGAALENLIRAAEARGLTPHLVPGPGPGPSLAVVRLEGSSSDPAGDPPAARPPRVTNRRAYDGLAVDPSTLGRLVDACPPVGGATTHWIVGDDRIVAFADLVGRADGVMFGEPTMRRAFLGSVRFDQPPGAEAAEGLPLDALELGGSDRLALRAVRRTPDWMLKLGGTARIFAQKSRRLVASSSGLCLVVAPDGSEAADLAVGRALQRSWVALADEGLATQPMMSPLVLENAEVNGDDALRCRLGPDRLRALRATLRAIAPEIGDGRPAWLLRFGHAPGPTGRTGRLPIDELAEFGPGGGG